MTYLETLHREHKLRQEKCQSMSMSGKATGRLWYHIHPDYQPNITREVSAILQAVSEVTRVGPVDLRGPYGLKHTAMARQLACYFMRRYTKLSLKKIGAALGGRDHSTIIYAVNKVENGKKYFEPWLSAVAAKLGVK